jgi:site-specific DNA-methyltransferase (adenine-specific)
MEPYYQDDAVTIYHADCRDILPALNVRAALIVADPPYGDTSLAWDRWPDGWIETLGEIAPQMWCFGSMRMWLDNGQQFREWWTYGQEVVWEKHNGSGFASDRFKRVHEFAVQWYQGRWGSLTINPQMTTRPHDMNKSVRRRGATPHAGAIDQQPYVDDGTRLQRSVVYVQSMQGSAIHPTEKPIGILEPLIRYSTNPGDLILDPFGGSCSTARAARSTGRRAICIEANEDYLKAAVNALAQGVLAL